MKQAALLVMLVGILAFVSVAQQPADSPPQPAATATADNLSGRNDESPDLKNDASSRSWIRNLGKASPLQPESGLALGPLRLKQIESSGFYQDISTPNLGSLQFWGTILQPAVAFDHPLHHGRIAIQYTPQFAVRDGEVINNFMNQDAGVDFNFPLSARWSLLLSSHFSYYKNEGLLNSQNLDAYTLEGNTLILQNRYVQRQNAFMGEDSQVSVTYRLNGRTELTLSPIVGASFRDDPGGWDFVTMLGGQAGISHMVTPTRRVFASYGVTHSRASSGLAGLGDWNYHTAAVGVDQSIGRTWTIQVTAGATYRQGQSQGSAWTPTGSVGIAKAFRAGSIAAAYSRSRADSLFLFSGYVDQGDLASSFHLARKTQMGIGVGEYRTMSSLYRQRGKKAYVSLSYALSPPISWFVSYSFVRQTGTNTGLFVGDNTYASVGLRWTPGRRPSF